MKEFRGSYTVLVTPFTEDGSKVDEKALRRLVEWQIQEGAPGLIPLGTTGEFLSITEEERTQIAQAVIDQTAGRVPVLVGTAAEWADEVIRYSREAERLGADGVMIVPPFYNSPTDDEVFEHYRRVGEAISIPIMLYNNLRTTNVDLTPPLVARLSAIDTVRYVKESSKDVSRVREIIRLCGDRMTVFSGHRPYDSYVLGALGYVSVLGNIVPRMSADLYTLTVVRRDLDGGRELYHRLLPLLDALDRTFMIPLVKKALAMMGMPVGIPRMPRLPLSAAWTPELTQILIDLGALAAARKVAVNA